MRHSPAHVPLQPFPHLPTSPSQPSFLKELACSCLLPHPSFIFISLSCSFHPQHSADSPPKSPIYSSWINSKDTLHESLFLENSINLHNFPYLQESLSSGFCDILIFLPTLWTFCPSTSYFCSSEHPPFSDGISRILSLASLFFKMPL